MLRKDIKQIVNDLAEEHETREPFRLAESIGILVRKADLGSLKGCCIRLAGQMVIFINQELDEALQRWVMAHELGHAVLHNDDWYFFSYGTSVYRSRAEIEANTFAVELLLADKVILEHPDYSATQLAMCCGCSEAAMEYK